MVVTTVSPKLSSRTLLEFIPVILTKYASGMGRRKSGVYLRIIPSDRFQLIAIELRLFNRCKNAICLARVYNSAGVKKQADDTPNLMRSQAHLGVPLTVTKPPTADWSPP
jgi:hypothetical protein